MVLILGSASNVWVAIRYSSGYKYSWHLYKCAGTATKRSYLCRYNTTEAHTPATLSMTGTRWLTSPDTLTRFKRPSLARDNIPPSSCTHISSYRSVEMNISPSAVFLSGRLDLCIKMSRCPPVFHFTYSAPSPLSSATLQKERMKGRFYSDRIW